MLDYFNGRLLELIDVEDKKQLEKALEQQLLELYDNTDHEQLKSSKVINNAGNKYRAASAMQKMIRRGRADKARDMAHGLLTLDPDYPWRRLCTVALEDVGVANVGLVAAFLWLSGKKAWRVNHGGDQKWLMMMVNEMANSPKDRNACDLLVWADLDFELDDLRTSVEKGWIQQVITDEEHLVDQICNLKNSIAERMIWAWVAAGTSKHNGRGFKNNATTPSMILNISNYSEFQKHPYIIQYIIRQGDGKQYEGMPMAFPLIWELSDHYIYTMLENKEMLVKDDDFISLPDIGMYPSCAFDIHTGEGKQAISKFVADTPQIKALVQGAPDARGAIGTTIFRVEGHQVNKRLQYPGGPDMVDIVDPIHMMGDGVRRHNVMEVYETVKANMNRLHWFRSSAMGDLSPVKPDFQPIIQQPAREVASSSAKKYKAQGIGLIHHSTQDPTAWPVIKTPVDATHVIFSLVVHGLQIFITVENVAPLHNPNWIHDAIYTGKLPGTVVEISQTFWNLHLSAMAKHVVKHAGFVGEQADLLASAAVDDFVMVPGSTDVIHAELGNRLAIILADEIGSTPPVPLSTWVIVSELIHRFTLDLGRTDKWRIDTVHSIFADLALYLMGDVFHNGNDPGLAAQASDKLQIVLESLGDYEDVEIHGVHTLFIETCDEIAENHISNVGIAADLLEAFFHNYYDYDAFEKFCTKLVGVIEKEEVLSAVKKGGITTLSWDTAKPGSDASTFYYTADYSTVELHALKNIAVDVTEPHYKVNSAFTHKGVKFEVGELLVKEAGSLLPPGILMLNLNPVTPSKENSGAKWLVTDDFVFSGVTYHKGMSLTDEQAKHLPFHFLHNLIPSNKATKTAMFAELYGQGPIQGLGNLPGGDAIPTTKWGQQLPKKKVGTTLKWGTIPPEELQEAKDNLMAFLDGTPYALPHVVPDNKPMWLVTVHFGLPNHGTTFPKGTLIPDKIFQDIKHEVPPSWVKPVKPGDAVVHTKFAHAAPSTYVIYKGPGDYHAPSKAVIDHYEVGDIIPKADLQKLGGSVNQYITIV